MEIIRQFTNLENSDYDQAEFRVVVDEDIWGEYCRVDVLLNGKWKEEDKIYGNEEDFQDYLKRWETTTEIWGI